MLPDNTVSRVHDSSEAHIGTWKCQKGTIDPS